MAKLIFVLGGAKSGKSLFAENLAKSSSKVAYIATAEVRDEEMADRIKAHRDRRCPEWETIEAPFELKDALLNLNNEVESVIIDCVTIYITNLLLKDGYNSAGDPVNENADISGSIIKDIEVLCGIGKKISSKVIFVSNEVGFGIVPENKLARDFRDIAGKVNQVIAQQADEVFFVVAGIARKIK